MAALLAFANLVFSAAMRLAIWLVDRVQVHASVLADGRPVLTASPPSGEVWRSYYYSGGQRIAMRVQDGSGDEVFYLLGDHLGSTTVTADGGGAFHSETRYGPWGEVLAQSGAMPSGYTYTGQFSYADDFGLLYYVARFYDPYLGRFAQADTIVPGVGDPGAFDRYMAMRNNPVKFNDPSGHCAQNGDESCWSIYEEIISKCPQCAGLVRATAEADLTLAEENSAYLETVLDRVNEGWDPEINESSRERSGEAFGVRVEHSSWMFAGGDLNLDFLYFSDTGEFGIFTTLGGQAGIGGGIGLTAGILRGENLPSRSSYGGPSYVVGGATVSVPLTGVEFEMDQSLGQPNPDGSIPTTTYYGAGASAGESGLYTGSGYTINWVGMAEKLISIFQ